MNKNMIHLLQYPYFFFGNIAKNPDT